MPEQPWKNRPHFTVVGEPLGEGSFGIVYKVQHNADKSFYAIKQVHVNKTLRHFKGDIVKLFREVILIPKINHENVVRYHYCWIEGPDGEILVEDLQVPSTFRELTSTSHDDAEKKISLFISMELCTSTLQNWLTQNPTLEARALEIPRILLQLAKALKVIHENNIIHRDLKPDNIFYIIVQKANGECEYIWKIGDFGLCKLAPQVSEDISHIPVDRLESAHTGNITYRCPDVQISTKSDVYTFGLIGLEVILYPQDLRSKFYDLLHYERNHLSHETEVRKLLENKGYEDEGDIICEMLEPRPDKRLSSQQVLEKLNNVYSNAEHRMEDGPAYLFRKRQNPRMTKPIFWLLASFILSIGLGLGILSFVAYGYKKSSIMPTPPTTTLMPFISSTTIAPTKSTTNPTLPPSTTQMPHPSPPITSLDQLKGMKIVQTKHLSTVTLHWKQGSILGIGGDEIHDYNVYVYTFEKTGANVLLFVQDDMVAEKSIVISNRLQYGCQNGEVFLVLHNKSRKPYQFRFVENKNALAEWATFANKQIKSFINYDPSWIAGDYLRDFK